MKMNFRLWVLGALFAGAASLTSAGEIAVLPPESTLTGPEASQRMLVVNVNEQGDYAGQLAGDAVKLASSDASVAEVIDGVVVPRGDGQVTITATGKDGAKAVAAVTVKNVGTTNEWSFRNHVLPVLSKGGCNMGACHGALAGKGGFRLSLRGYDPEADWHTITREARGRRIELDDPGRSLLLTKATTALKHTGGLRVEEGSRDYRILAEWISAGAAAPQKDDARLQTLEIFPHQSTLQPGDELNLVVKAHYSDGREEDVTQWAKFTSSNEAVAMVGADGSASVDDHGRTSIIGHGEGAITAWFSSKIVIARISSPFPNELNEDVFTSAPRRNFVDELVLAQLQRLNLKPSQRTSDEQFLRRVFIDTIGVLPTLEEAEAFLKNQKADKRDRLIESLLQRPEFVDHWAYRISDMLLVNGRKLRPAAVEAYYKFIRSQIEANTPWDEFVSQIITSQGSSTENGATNFYAVHQDPENMAENVSQAFLSLSLGCAKCHDHPLEKWTNDQYYAFANIFSRVRGKGWGGDPRNGDGERTIYVADRGDLMQPRTGKPQPPAALDAEPIPEDFEGDRRTVLAEWLTSADNEHFRRSITNRIWAYYFGIGLVDPVDDLRASNPASNEPLLAALAEHLVENDFDLKALMRTILQSETYQRSSVALPENADEKRFFSRYYPRRMMAEKLHDAVVSVTGVPSMFTAIKRVDGSVEETKAYPEGTRALELYDAAVDSYFLQAFGRNAREISCECERSNQPSLVQVLHVSNGKTLNEKLRDEKSVVSELMKKPDAELIADAYLRTLTRRPTELESTQFVELLAATPKEERRTAVEDLLWALMSSREFLFQH
jgi:hypothetical protein